MAFYKYDGELLEAPTAIESMDFALYAEFYEQYSYPVFGWYWFDTRAEALEFFGLPQDEQVIQ